MTFRQVLLGLAPLFAAASAHAADDRLRSVFYDPERVIRIAGRPNIQSTIEFGPDERIENIAVGDSSAWQVTPNRRGSIIFVKPIAAATRTNMTVVTDRRTYLFDLVAVGKDVTPLYSLKFSYPANESLLSQESAAPEEEAAKPESTSAVATTTVDELNFDWKVKGSRGLLPKRVFDDGSSLYFSWDPRQPLPAVLTVGENGTEGPLNYRLSGNYVVVSPVPMVVVVRYGKESAELTRLRPLPTPPPAPALPVQQQGHVAMAEVSHSVPQATAATANPDPTVARPRIADLLSDHLEGGH